MAARCTAYGAIRRQGQRWRKKRSDLLILPTLTARPMRSSVSTCFTGSALGACFTVRIMRLILSEDLARLTLSTQYDLTLDSLMHQVVMAKYNALWRCA